MTSDDLLDSDFLDSVSDSDEYLHIVAFNEPESGVDATHKPKQPRTPYPGSVLTRYTIPPENHQHEAGASDAAKSHLTDESPDRQRCLITLSERSLECAHVLRLSAPSSLLLALEYAWGMELGTLNPGTTQNTIWLSPNLHAYFDVGDWGLVPSLTDLQTIQAASLRELSYFPKTEFTQICPQRIHTYDFVHFKPSTEPLLRLESTGSNDYTVHMPPYSTLSPIRSHVSPYFVICNIAEKDKQHCPNLNSSNSDQGYSTLQPGVLERVRLCRTIYDLWEGQMGTAETAWNNQSNTPAALPQSNARGGESQRSNPEQKAKSERNDHPDNNQGDNPAGCHEVLESTPACIFPTPQVEDGLDVQDETRTEPSGVKVMNWLMEVDLLVCPCDSASQKQAEETD